ncbi:MAG: hypothetical protein QW292_13550, partial [Candidatus Parvarchaeota archaeon]
MKKKSLKICVFFITVLLMVTSAYSVMGTANNAERGNFNKYVAEGGNSTSSIALSKMNNVTQSSPTLNDNYFNQSFSITLGNVNTSYLENVSIPVYMHNGKDFTNLIEIFSFDPSLLTFNGIINDVSSNNVSFSTVNLTKGIVKVYGNGTFINLPYTTTLYYLEFSPVIESQISTTVLLDYSILNGTYYNSTSSSSIILARGWTSFGPRNVPIKPGVPWGPHMSLNGTGMTNTIAFSPNFPNIIYEGSGGVANYGAGGIMKSTNGGQSWEQVDLGINYTMIQYIWVDYSNPNIAVAMANGFGSTAGGAGGLEDGGIFKTVNGGMSWQFTYPGWGDTLQFVPGKGLYAFELHSVLFSGNLGSTWKVISLTNNWILSGLVTDQGMRIELAEDISGTSLMKVFISNNSGISYNSSYQSFLAVNQDSIISDPSNSSIQWMIHWEGITNDSLLKSENGGLTWKYVNYSTIDLSSMATQVIAYDPANTSIMYMGGDAWEAKSINGGNSFSILNNVVLAAYVIVVDPLNDSTVYVGGEQGIVVSHDGGNNWEGINNRSSSITEGIATDGNNCIISLGNFNPVYSTDNGSSWILLPRYAGIIGVLRFEGGHETVDPYNNSIVLYAAGQMEISHDGGLNYSLPKINQSWVDNPAASETDAFAFAPNSSTIFYAGNSGILVSDNSGYTWTVLNNSPKNCSAIAGSIIANKFILYASNYSGLFYSSDYGLTWSKINNYSVETMSIDPYNSSIMAATVSTKAMISYDGGKTFFYANQSSTQTPYVFFYPEVIYQKLSNGTAILYFVSNRGVFATTDQGETWKNVTYNLPTLTLNSMEIYGNTCYVTTQGSGIFYDPSLFNLSYRKSVPILTGYLPHGMNLSVNGVSILSSGFFSTRLKQGLNSINTGEQIYINATDGNIYFFNFTSLQIVVVLRAENIPASTEWSISAGGKIYNITGNATVTIPLGAKRIYIFPIRSDYSIYYPLVNNISLNSSIFSSFTIPFKPEEEVNYQNVSNEMGGNFWTTQIAINRGDALYGGGGNMVLLNLSTMQTHNIGNPFPNGQVFSVSSFSDGFIIGGTISPNRPGLAFYDLASGSFNNLSSALPSTWNGSFAQISSVFAIGLYSFGFIGGTSNQTFLGLIDNNSLINLSPHLPSYFESSGGNLFSGAYIQIDNSLIISSGSHLGLFSLVNDSYSDLTPLLPISVSIEQQYSTISKAYIASDGTGALILGTDQSNGRPFVGYYSPASGMKDLSDSFPTSELYDSVTWNGRDFVLSGKMVDGSPPEIILYDPSNGFLTTVGTSSYGNVSLIDSAILHNSSLLFTSFNSREERNYSVLSSRYGIVDIKPTGEMIVRTNVPATLNINSSRYYGSYFPIPEFPGSYEITLNSSGYSTEILPIRVIQFSDSYYNITLERLYTITFIESGLPLDTFWSVTLNGTLETSTTSTISFTEPNGSYYYTVGIYQGYSSSPYSSSVTVSGSPVSVSVTFTQVKYSVTFSET